MQEAEQLYKQVQKARAPDMAIGGYRGLTLRGVVVWGSSVWGSGEVLSFLHSYASNCERHVHRTWP